MAFFSRTKASEPKAFDSAAADGTPFDATRRSPRRARIASEHDPDPSSPLDPAEAAKTRARRRLIGAIALALAAIVFVPMLFDRSQAPEVDDIAVQIPDRNSPFEGRKGVPEPSRTPLAPSTSLPAPVEETAAPVARVEEPRPVVEAQPEAKAPVQDKTVDKSKAADAKTAEAKDRAAKPAGDDPRALAALEGKVLPAAPSSEADAGKSFAVQIAAFSAVDRAKGLRDQLVSNGLKAYTEPLSTAQGPRTRVRLGPYATRDAAERAKQKLKTMKLDGSIVAL